ncbi:uncharacterized protein Triagg1_7101 [Trichoderma aggressivum f. europaeum]|uniref:NACHT domain-containing protein n=1 Tax=Trichoderma aggressivum f. europaeum TaxID=173218 RepID=A0AAE1IA52_9HYPO|nr:hypothetical protein Triagg1_7101 [Trichoderma aggressivum f. europaeum]
MDNSRNFSGNTLGSNATINQGNITQITVHTSMVSISPTIRHWLTDGTDTSNADKSFLPEISKTDPFYDKQRILTLKGPLLWDSFSWILRHEQFDEWRHAKESGVLWIKGDPGKGKTMLLCGIIEDLEQNPQSENLSYFFCQAADYRINTGTAVVGGLIKSLLKRHPRLLSRVRESYEDKLKDQLDGANALVILCDIFETITNDPGLTDVICIVDALDECIQDCRLLLNLIIKTSGHVKWLLSSRNEKDMEKMLDQVPQKLILELKQNAERISTSIDAYIRHHIHEIEALKGDEQLQARALDILESKSQGTFLWVALVVEQLHKTDHWDVENVLEEVPKDLESLYGLILDQTEKLGKNGQEVCQVLLSIVATAKRPLHLGELLIFINSHWKDSRHFKTTYELRDVRDMAKTCGSILSIRDNTVYFIHQSAKDYVVGNAAHRIFPILHQHHKMFEASLDAMSNVLKYDIYGLEDPAKHIDDIPLKDVDSDPLAAGTINPRDALQKLKDLIESYHGSGSIESEISQTLQLQREREIQSLRQFTDDAYRFVENSKESVAYWPLQLYFSAMAFEQGSCGIRTTFQRTVHEKFGPSPILANVQQGQSNLRVRSAFNVPEDPFAYIETIHVSQSMISSPDSWLVVRMNANGSILELRFWRVDSGTLEHTFKISWGSKIAFIPNSNEFISASQDGIIKMWNLDKRCCVGEQYLHFKCPRPGPQFGSIQVTSITTLDPLRERVIALSPKGELVASWHRKSSDGPGLIKIWDAKTTCCGSSFESGEAPSMHAAFSPNIQLLAVSYDDGVRVHSVKTGAIVQYLRYLDNRTREEETRGTWNGFNPGASRLEHVWFSPNSEVLVAMVSKRELHLWDTHTWKLLHYIEENALPKFLSLLGL